MKIYEYERQPRVPEVLNNNGKEFWELYCNYYLSRDYLTSDLLPEIETLSFLQQQRVDMQNEINKNGRSSDNMKELKDLVTQIRLLKDALKIQPRANEFHKPKGEKEDTSESEQTPAHISVLNAKNF